MDKIGRTDSLKYYCQCSKVYLVNGDIKNHLTLPGLHKISRVINTPPSPQKNKNKKSALEHIQTLTQTQIQIQAFSNNLIQTISKNTEIAMKNLNDLMRIYKDLINYESEKKIKNNRGIISNFSVKPSLNTEIVNHFQQKFLIEDFKPKKIIKKLRKKIYSLFENFSFRLNCIAISSDENFVALGDVFGLIRIWDLITNVQVYQFMKHKSCVTSLALGEGSNIMLSGSKDCSIRLWNVQSQKHLFKFEGHLNSVISVLISKHNKLGYSCSYDKTIIIWNLLYLNKQNKICLSRAASSIILFNKSNILLVGDFNGDLTIWNTKNIKRQKKIKVSDSKVSCMSHSKDEEILIVGCLRFIKIYKTKDFSSIFCSEKIKEEIISVDISPDSKKFCYCTTSVLNVCDLTNFTAESSFNSVVYFLKCACFSKISQNFILFYNCNQITYYSPINKNQETKVDLYQSGVLFKIDISRDLKYIAYGTYNLCLFNLELDKIVSEISNSIIFLKFNSNSTYLVTKNAGCSVYIYEVPLLIKIKELNINNYEIINIDISNDGIFIPHITSTNRLWIICSTNNSIVYQNQDCEVFDMAFCSNDERFIFLEPQSSIHILDKNFIELKVIKFSQRINAIIASLDSQLVFLKNFDQTLQILNLKTYAKHKFNKPAKEKNQHYKGIINEECLMVLKILHLKNINRYYFS